MEKYFLIDDKRVVKGTPSGPRFIFAESVWEYADGKWKRIDPLEINDRLMGYDPYESGLYAIGNTEILDEIREIPESELSFFAPIRRWWPGAGMRTRT